jgi:hypothetical protein
LLLSLAPGSGEGLRVVKLTPVPAVNAPVLFSANAPNAPAFEALAPDGTRQRLTATDAATADGAAWQAGFTPRQTGIWEVHATDASGRQASVRFPVAEKLVSAESLDLPADVTGMQQLAESTGGTLVRDPGDFQLPVEPAAGSVAKTPQPLWNSGVLLLAMLGLYSTELITRRRFKLL